MLAGCENPQEAWKWKFSKMVFQNVVAIVYILCCFGVFASVIDEESLDSKVLVQIKIEKYSL